MEELVLTDKNIYPAEEVIFSHIKKSKATWNSIFKYIHTNHPELNEEWRYYNDGKSWLLKVTLKTKTLFWLAVVANAFIITFYFSEKTVQSFSKLSISKALDKKIKQSKKVGKSTALTFLMNDKQNIELVKEAIELKIKTK
ncbi:MAG: DUF3788 family protein [Ignavibacterium sp.]|nr:DUF3788 family protein [Ignavibacterium sp.]